MYRELFKFEDGEVRPLSSREATLREVRLILQRDKGSPGDSDGRKKSFAYKELGAVYWIADYRSSGRQRGYEGQDLIDDAIKNFNLPEDWQPDKTISDLIKKYEYNVGGGVAAEVLTEIASTFNIMLKTTKAIRKRLHDKLAVSDIKEDDLKNLIALQSEMLKLTSDIPKKIKEIEVAKEMLKQSESEARYGRGGGKITSSMVPPKFEK